MSLPSDWHVEPTDRGFRLALPGPKRIPWGLTSSGAVLGGLIGLVMAGIGVANADAMSVFGGVVLAVVAVGGALVSQWWEKSGTRMLVVDGNRLEVPAEEGHTVFELTDLKNVVAIPAGIAFHRRSGPTLHVLVRGRRGGIAWLENELESRAAAFGTAGDVPDAIRELKADPRDTQTD